MKVAIVGGGICGLYLGWKLAERGQDVSIFEKRGRIGKEVCSGLFSERILEFIPQSRNLIQSRSDFVLIRLSRKTLKIKFSGESLMIKHSDLDNLTADLARKAGAKIILNRKVSESDLNAFQQSFDRIIGCDGADSFVRKNLGLPSPDLRLAIQGFFSGTVPVKLDCVETWPTQSGFLWKIPRQGEIEYGIIEKPKKAKKFFEEFLRKNNLKLERIDSALVPEGLIIPKNDKITLCGDAAGLAKPWSGGGVIWGLTAANFLLKDFPDFLKYRKAARKFFLPEIIFSKTIKKMVYLFGFKFPWLLPKEVNMGGDFLLF